MRNFYPSSSSNLGYSQRKAAVDVLLLLNKANRVTLEVLEEGKSVAIGTFKWFKQDGREHRALGAAESVPYP